MGIEEEFHAEILREKSKAINDLDLGCADVVNE
jgi:hypothetical protein